VLENPAGASRNLSRQVDKSFVTVALFEVECGPPTVRSRIGFRELNRSREGEAAQGILWRIKHKDKGINIFLQ
jgi:hypothetical protein